MKKIILCFLFAGITCMLYSQKVVISNHNIDTRSAGNKYLACQGGNTANNTAVIIWDDEYQRDIMWIKEQVATAAGESPKFKLKNEKSNKYLAVAGGGRTNGSKIILYDDNRQADIVWTEETGSYSGEVRIKNVSSGKYLAVEGGSNRNGAALVLWSNESQLDINWRVSVIDPFSPAAITGGTVFIRNRNTIMVMAETNSANFSNVVQRSSGAGNELRWTIEQQRDGYYKIKNAESNKYIGVRAASNDAGAEIVITPNMEQPDILWEITMYGPHSYKIKNKQSGLYIGVQSASHAAGAKLVQWTDENQRDILWGITDAY